MDETQVQQIALATTPDYEVAVMALASRSNYMWQTLESDQTLWEHLRAYAADKWNMPTAADAQKPCKLNAEVRR